MMPSDRPSLIPISSSASSIRTVLHHDPTNPNPNLQQLQQKQPEPTQPPPPPPPPPPKKKRSLPGTPDPEAEVIALSPATLMATNRFVCEICNKGFQRDQNLQLHRRGHNLPWKLRQRTAKDMRKKVYVCPETTCVHHHPSRALGDLTGIKKHYSRKHGEKKWKCDKCSKKYAVQSDWKAHCKTCGTREYKCDCGTVFSRKDSFVTHRAFCDALMEETTRLSTATNTAPPPPPEAFIGGSSNDRQHITFVQDNHPQSFQPQVLVPSSYSANQKANMSLWSDLHYNTVPEFLVSAPTCIPPDVAMPSEEEVALAGGTHDEGAMSATALLQKAAQMGASVSGSSSLSVLAGLAGYGNTMQQQLSGGVREANGEVGTRTPAVVGPGGWAEMAGGMAGGKTRDFLGLGRGEVGETSGPFSPQELARLASFGGPMDMLGSATFNCRSR